MKNSYEKRSLDGDLLNLIALMFYRQFESLKVVVGEIHLFTSLLEIGKTPLLTFVGNDDDVFHTLQILLRYSMSLTFGSSAFFVASMSGILEVTVCHSLPVIGEV